MLRQVFLFSKSGEQIFAYHFAQAYDFSTVDLAFNQRLQPYIINPIEGKIISKPMFDFQSHFGMFQDVFFLFVSDMADRPKTIGKEIQRAAKLFHKNFPSPEVIKGSSSERDEFTVFIKETHYYLHPKICLIGPVRSGKSHIINLLKTTDKPEKMIMNFAEYYRSAH